MTLTEIWKVLTGASRILVTSHISPDPDATGSSCGLALALSSLGKDVMVYLQDPLPERMVPLVSGVRFFHFEDSKQSQPFDLVVSVDAASRSRIGKAVNEVFALAPTGVNIDHHVSNHGWSDVNYVDAAASSTAEIIFDMLVETGFSLPSPDIANLLYSGLCDDTGSFRYSNTTAKAFRTAASLVDAGARPSQVAKSLYFSNPERVFRLRGLALNQLQIVPSGDVVYLVVTLDMLSRAGATAEDTEGLIDEVRSVEGGQAALVIRELEEGVWKVSLRAKNEDLDVNVVAARFGGGGHRAAAGCKIQGTQTEVVQLLLEALHETNGLAAAQ